MTKRRDDDGRTAGEGPVLCPEARKSASVQQRDGRAVLDLETYIPYFLAAVNNPLSRGASQHYLEAFGVGIVEWRVIAMLAVEPRVAATRICAFVGLDKGATSRALARLEQLGYVCFAAAERDSRRRIWWLNQRGYDLHDRILAVALERERALIRGVDPDDLEAFLRVMRIMRQNVEQPAGDAED